jgi:hypothetical protein
MVPVIAMIAVVAAAKLAAAAARPSSASHAPAAKVPAARKDVIKAEKRCRRYRYDNNRKLYMSHGAP